MRAYSIFDDFDARAQDILREAGIALTVHPLGLPRPDARQMQTILEDFDCVIIGTSQKLTPEMFERIDSERVIGTASVGVDHIRYPESKRHLIRVFNTPTANACSVAEYTVGVMLQCVKRLREGEALYRQGKNNKALRRKPEDIAGKTLGVIGAGNISQKIMTYAQMLGMEVICWTAHPERHETLKEAGIRFVGLRELAERADAISVNLPNNEGTRGIISDDLIDAMKPDAVFISVSRLETVNLDALCRKAMACPDFRAVLDIDVDERVVSAVRALENVIVTPHIAGGTVETRKRMFREVATQISQYYQRQDRA